MPPRYELNDRFKAHVRKRQQLRMYSAAALSVCLIIATGYALTNTTAVVATASASLSAFASTIVAPIHAIPDTASNAFASLGRTTSSALGETAGAASASASSLLNTVIAFVGKFLPAHNVATSSREPANTNAQPPSKTSAATSPEPQPQPVPSQGLVLAAATSTKTSQATSRKPSTKPATANTAIVQRVVVKEIPAAFTGVTLGDLAALRSELLAKLAAATLPPPPVPQQVAAGGTTVIYQGGASPAAQRIDQLNNVTLNNPTIIGGSLSGTSGAGGGGGIGDNATTTTFFSSLGHFTSGVIDALTSAASTIASLGTTELVATNSTTTNLYVSGTARIGSGTGVLQSTNGVVSHIANGSDGQVLKISGGVSAWGTDNTGSGGGSSVWATTTDSLAVYLATPSNVILVGTNATSTTGNILEVKGNTLLRGNQITQGAVTASSFTATSSTASQLPYASTTAVTATTASTTNLYVSSASGGLLKTNAQGFVSIASPGTDYLNSTAGDWSGTLGGFTAAQLIAAGFSTTSANYFISQNTGLSYSTTSANYWLTTKTSSNVAEGSNLYYTANRVAGVIAGTTTTALAEGTNLYFTNARADTRVAAGIAGTTTDALAQGVTNKYWSNTLFDNRLSATTSLSNIITLANLSLPASQLTNFGNPFYTFFHGTTTDALAEGSSNLYYTANRVASVIAGTTTTALAEGNNLYFTNARADTRVAAGLAGTTTTALGVMFGRVGWQVNELDLV
jgi:hypothetical protein